ncbi:hypothetical protein ACNFIC_11720 [Pseudomonas sp. NY15463]|uniref:hypothetical protein n=1 Tax=Pseudomonas sp. NY15463 TaxID=3400361 RepID=UPI003A8B48CA
MYVADLDEFGHIGPFVSKEDPSFHTHPVFGLAGLVLPAEKVREFSAFFFNLKKNVLGAKIEKTGTHPAAFEEKLPLSSRPANLTAKAALDDTKSTR